MSSEPPLGTSPATMDELRRIAFGRGSTDEERAAATRSLEALAAAEDAARPEAVPAPGGGTDDEVETDANESTVVAVPGPARRRSIPLVLLLPAVIASLVVGGIAGGATTPSPVPVTAPVTTHRHLDNSTSEPGTPTPGNLIAANAWLDRTPTSADTFPNPALISLQKLSSVRHLKNIDYDGTPITLWAAKDDNSGLCLITSVPGGIFGTQCTPANDFANHGITGGFNGLEVSWNGDSTSVRLSMSGLKG